MRLTYILSLVGVICAGVGLCMLAPMGVSLYYGEEAWRAFLGGACIGVAAGGGRFWLFRDRNPKELSHREGLAGAAAGVLGGAPLILSGDFATFADAVFEAVSGFTTTGASVLANVEAAG